jgi:hypothetical protein
MRRSRRKSRQLSRRDTAVQLRGGRAKLRRTRTSGRGAGGMPWPPNRGTEGEDLTRATEARPRATTDRAQLPSSASDLGGSPT